MLHSRRRHLRTTLLIGLLVFGQILSGLLIGSWMAQPASAQAEGGPLLVYGVYPGFDAPGVGGLWVARADGSDRKLVAPDKAILRMVASPDNRYVAYIAYDPDPLTLQANVTLNLLSLSDLTTRTLTALTTPDTAMKSVGDRGPTEALTFGGVPSLVWSPDGQALAFIGAQGPSKSADLFVYSLKDDKITGLSDGPSQAVAPSWSPDGKYILHFGIAGFGTGAGDVYAGVWVARADDSGVTTLYTPAGGGEGSLGWVDNTSFLAWSWDVQCGAGNIRAYNVETKQETVWVADHHQAAAFDPVSGTLLFAIGESFGGCTSTLKPGLYRMTRDNPTPTLLSADLAVAVLQWSPVANGFAALLMPTGETLVFFNTAGDVSQPAMAPGQIPQFASNPAYWAWTEGEKNTLKVSGSGGMNLASATTIAENVSGVIWVR